MAKKKESEFTPDAVIASIIAKNKATLGAAYLSKDHREYIYGVKIPALPFQWMIGGINVIPLSRVICISGYYGSMKSTLSMEIGTWFMKANGVEGRQDSENKTAPGMYSAIRYDLAEELRARSVHEHANSSEAWMQGVLNYVEACDSNEARACPPGHRVPVCCFVDSINGKESESESAQLMEKGHSESRGYATLNNQIKKFFAAVPLFGVPMLLGYTAHLKDEIPAATPGARPGPPKQKELGGASASFYATLVLRLKAVGTVDYVGADKIPIEGKLIQITAHKSALGPNNRSITVPCVWRYVDDPSSKDGFRQEAWWDWDWALGFLIWRGCYDDKGFSGHERDAFKALFPVVKDGGSWTTPKYQELAKREEGHVTLFDDGEAHSMIELGIAVSQRPELMEKLRVMLRIMQCNDVQEIAEIPGSNDEKSRSKRKELTVEKVKKMTEEVPEEA
jgi:hypothetical protein